MIKGLAIFIFTLLYSIAIANSKKQLSPQQLAIYQDIIYGKTLKANRSILQLKNTSKPNTVLLWLEDYNEFVKLYLLENKKDYNDYLNHNQQRIKAIKAKKENNAWYLYALSETYLHQAFACFLFEDYTSGFWNMRRAYLMLKENQKKYPTFKPNEKNLALVQAITGILPEKYYWIINLLGIEPNFEKGISTLKTLATDSSNLFHFQEETTLIYGTLLFHAGSNKALAIQFFQQQQFPKKDNLLGSILITNLCLHSNNNIKAANILNNLPFTDEYLKVPQIQYLKGIQQLQILNSKSISYFKEYIATTQSENFIKSSYHKIAWSNLLQNNKLAYKESMNNILQKGNATREADKQAVKETESNTPPQIDLLKIRLLFDAGLFLQAQQKADSLSLEKLTTEKDQLEYTYRKARLAEKQNQEALAIKLFNETIEKGEKLPYYFAANAALQLGYIYQNKKDKPKANYYFEKSLSFKNHEYVNSISQKAKTAMQQH